MSLARIGADEARTRNGVDRVFERLGHVGLDHLRIRAGIGRQDQHVGQAALQFGDLKRQIATKGMPKGAEVLEASANPNPGVRTFQRLNRPEYARAVSASLMRNLPAQR